LDKKLAGRVFFALIILINEFINVSQHSLDSSHGLETLMDSFIIFFDEDEEIFFNTIIIKRLLKLYYLLIKLFFFFFFFFFVLFSYFENYKINILIIVFN